MSSRELKEYDRQAWAAGRSFRAVLLRYVHDCTSPGDRVLVTGSTPFQVGYLVERPIAGGHLFWRDGWRRDADRSRGGVRKAPPRADRGFSLPNSLRGFPHWEGELPGSSL